MADPAPPAHAPIIAEKPGRHMPRPHHVVGERDLSRSPTAKHALIPVDEAKETP